MLIKYCPTAPELQKSYKFLIMWSKQEGDYSRFPPLILSSDTGFLSWVISENALFRHQARGTEHGQMERHLLTSSGGGQGDADRQAILSHHLPSPVGSGMTGQHIDH